MDNKKAILVVFLAIVLAFIVVSCIYKKNNTILPEIEPQEEKVIDNTIEKQADITNPNNELKTDIKPDIKQVIKPIKTEVEYPVIKPLQVEEAKEPVAKLEESDFGISQEVGTNDIIIHKEFKSESPAKYSFEGFGVQKAPIK